MSDPLPFACQAAAIDGEPALSLHQETCTACQEREPQPDLVFDLPDRTREQGPTP